MNILLKYFKKFMYFMVTLLFLESFHFGLAAFNIKEIHTHSLFILKRAVESLKLPFALSPSAALRRAPSKGER